MLINIQGTVINSSRIIWVENLWHEKKTDKCRVHFDNGDRKEFAISPDAILAESGTIVPNTGNFRVVMAILPEHDGGHAIETWTIPVLAFRIMSSFGGPSPITVEGEVDSYTNPWALLGPDGCCHFGGGENAASVEEWVKMLEARSKA